MTGLGVARSATYRTIVADPPWPFRWDGGAGGRRRRATPLPYPTMSLEQIESLPVAEWAHRDGCHLFLWATEEQYREGRAVAVARAWGFEPVSTLIWRKPNFGVGHFPRAGHEPLLVCRRGSPRPLTRRDVHSVQTWAQPRTSGNGGKQHSRKPEGALDLIEQASEGPYLEMFARRARFGWDYWGDESLGTAELPGDVARAAA
jgi:N6-adenosine-specific RNA methylase IME4